ncbi:hypothetical protein MHU86_3458 [Fragilaria crotonensis]|nr:hypothetical protein MHU86_3458 [Fragilaria crotonensis]
MDTPAHHVADRSPKPKKKPTKFQPGHCIEYGLEVCQRDPKTSQVIGVQCLFCIYIGKEDNRGQAAKRQRTANIFNVGWDAFKGRFAYLRQFVAGDWALCSRTLRQLNRISPSLNGKWTSFDHP